MHGYSTDTGVTSLGRKRTLTTTRVSTVFSYVEKRAKHSWVPRSY